MNTFITLSRYEFKKLFRKKTVIIIVIFFFAFNILNIIKNYNLYNPFTEEGLSEIGRYGLYTEYKGEISKEKYNDIKENYLDALSLVQSGNYDTEYSPDKYYGGYAYGEAMFKIELYNEVERLISYKEECNTISEKADALYNKLSDGDVYKTINGTISEDFKNRRLSTITNCNNVTGLLDYKLSSLLTIILALIGTVTIFTADCESNTLLYLKSAVNGGRFSAMTKLVASVGFTLFISVIFILTDFILFTFLLKLDGFSQPIYILKEFACSPLDVSIGQYLLILFASRITATICVCLTIAFISLIFKKTLHSLSLSALYLAFLMCIKAFITSEGLSINTLNPLSLLLLSEVTTGYSFTDVFGKPIYTYIVFISAVILASFITLICILIKGGRNVKG